MNREEILITQSEVFIKAVESRLVALKEHLDDFSEGDIQNEVSLIANEAIEMMVNFEEDWSYQIYIKVLEPSLDLIEDDELDLLYDRLNEITEDSE